MNRIWSISSIAAAAMIGLSGLAIAKPHDIQSTLKVDLLPAIHTPTGCMAKMEYHGERFVGAFITDPLCLPGGVLKQPIPSNQDDFYRLRASEVQLTGQ